MSPWSHQIRSTALFLVLLVGACSRRESAPAAESSAAGVPDSSFVLMSGRLVADAGRLGSDTTIVTCDDQQTAAAASALILDLYQSQLDQSGGRCVPQVTTTTSKGGILAFHAPGSPGIPVPATGPDSVPEWVYADSNLILPTAETYPAAVASRVLVVAFEPSADSLARAAFVNAHGLEVVGGYAGPEGAEILGVIT